MSGCVTVSLLSISVAMDKMKRNALCVLQV